jgi:hypothetical protein
MKKIKRYSININLAKKIEDLLLGKDLFFSWYFNPSTVDLQDIIKRKNTLDTPQFTHVFFSDHEQENKRINSTYYYEVINILKDIDISLDKIKFFKIKANLNLNINGYKKNNHQPVHLDNYNKNYRSFVYYVNDSDGDTLFFDNNQNITDRFSPKKGTGILFNSNIRHAGQNPINHYTRAVINFVWEDLC